jgi:PKD repeat protein
MKQISTILITLILLTGGSLIAQTPPCDPPVIICPDGPFEITMCGPGEICVDLPVIQSNSPIQIDAGIASLSADKRGEILCYDIESPGTYDFPIIAQNECGADTCMLTVIVTINSAPIITCPVEPFDTILCDPGQVCFDLPISGDANIEVVGAAWDNGQLCFDATETGIYYIDVYASNGCGADTCHIEYYVEIQVMPMIDCPMIELSSIICEPQDICIDLSVMYASQVISDYGTWANDEFCFFADTAGVYSLTIIASNACWEAECQILYNVTMKSAPVIECLTEPFPLTVCQPGENCIPIDIDNPENVEVDMGAYWAEGMLCANFDTTGVYTFTITAHNECGDDECQVAVNCTILEPPDVACPSEPIELTICDAGEVKVVVLIFGQFDYVEAGEASWADDTLTFQADTSGRYEFTVSAGNICGEDECTFYFDVTIGTVPETFCPDDDFTFDLCEPDSICIDLPISNPGTVTTTFGAWENDQFCFYAFETESYSVTVIADDYCGADTCQFTIHTSVTSAPGIDCPDSPVEITTCLANYYYIPVPIANADQIVIEGGEYINGQVKMLATETGVYPVSIIASNECGADTCEFDVDLTVILHPQPRFSIDSVSQGVSPVIIYFSNDTELSGTMEFEWNFGDGNTSTDFDGVNAYDTNGCYDVSLYCANECGTSTYTIYDFICITDAQVVIPTTEWIDIYCQEPTLNDEPLMPDDIISAYDPDGTLCGMGYVKEDGSFGFIPIYRDDPYTEMDEGAEPGDPITLLINFAQVYANPPVIWSENGQRIEVCTFSTQKCLELNLVEGWNLISWNVAYQTSVEDFIAGWEECVDIILGFDQGALTYNPDLPEYSTLETLDYHHGYWFKLNCDKDITLCAGEIDPNQSIPVYNGWNLVSYWPDATTATENGFQSVLAYLMVAMGYDAGGLTWLPDMEPFNTLVELGPGFGYWMKLTQDDYLIYPGFAAPVSFFMANVPVIHEVTPTRNWVSIYGSDISIDDIPLEAYSTVEVYSQDGTLCGKAVYSGEMLKFCPIYGHEQSSTITATYPLPGDEVDVFINGEKVYPTITWIADGDCINISDLLSKPSGSSPVLPEHFSLSQNYPNPFNPSTVIKFAIANPSQVELTVYNMLGRKVATLINDYFEIGEFEAVWNGLDSDGSPVSSGLYLYRLKAGDNVQTKKMILTK